MIRFPEFVYRDFAFYGAANRNKVQRQDEAKIPSDGADHYAVWFRYRRELLDWVTEHGTIKGAPPMMHYADHLTWDIDDPALNEAKARAQQLVEKLLGVGIQQAAIGASFSGSKGFHVRVPMELFDALPTEDFSSRCRTLALHLADGVAVDTAIYDRARLLRIPNTRHGKTGLWKTDIPLPMLLGASEDIRAYAAEPKARINFPSFRPDKRLAALWEKTAREARPKRAQPSGPAVIPKNRKLCIHTILQGVSEGVRHDAAFRLIDHYRSEGFPEHVTEGLIEAWGGAIDAQEPWGKLIRDVYGGNYDYGCNDPLLRGFCSPDCYLAKTAAVDTSELLTFEDRVRRYQEYVEKLESRRFRSGWLELDQEIRGVAPGELLTIVAYSGTYKSAMLEHLMLHAGRTMPGVSLMYSLEMPVEKVHEREMQMTTDLAGWEVEKAYKGSDVFRLVQLAATRGSNRFVVCERGGLTLDQIEELTGKARARFGEVSVVGIDYVGLMRGKGAGKEYELLNELYPRLKEFSKRASLPVVLLSQVNRETADTEVTKKSGKGTGAVEASADFLLGLYRDKEKVIAKLLKNRNGAEGQRWVLGIDGRTMALQGLTRYVTATKRGEKGAGCEFD